MTNGVANEVKVCIYIDKECVMRASASWNGSGSRTIAVRSA